MEEENVGKKDEDLDRTYADTYVYNFHLEKHTHIHTFWTTVQTNVG